MVHADGPDSELDGFTPQLWAKMSKLGDLRDELDELGGGEGGGKCGGGWWKPGIGDLWTSGPGPGAWMGVWR